MSESLSREHLDELWRRMSRIYGAAWVSGYGSSDDDTWLRGLHDFTPQDLAIGLEACTLQKPDEDGNLFPPNLPKFRALCRPKSMKPAYHDLYITLPAPTIAKEDALAHLAQIKEMLK